MTTLSNRTRQVPAIVIGVVLLLCGFAAPLSSAPEADTYANPVTEGVVDTFPDPTVVRGKDGFWYAFGTQNPVFQSQGEDGERILPILRSGDMANWEYAGEVFTPRTQPSWHEGSRLWAPDIRYAQGRYYLYYSVSDGNTVGVATAPTPTGPWTDRGQVLPDPSGCPTGNIDQAQFTDTDGTAYMYWGSYDTICVAKLNADLTRTEGEVTQVARGSRMEGGFVVHRGGFYYLFYSDAGCCDGAFSGYHVKVGRGTSPTGPFVDDRGIDLMAPTSKGRIVLGANGNRWIGPGHNGFQTDLSGQDWMLYHGIPSENPDLDPIYEGTLQLSRRPMLIDRVDWIDGWPVVRAGAGASEGDQPAPVTSWQVGSTFNDNSLVGWRPEGDWSIGEHPDALGHVSYSGSAPGYLASAETGPRDLRAEADLRVHAGAAGLAINYVDPENHVVAWLDKDRKALRTDVVVDGRSQGETETPLPAGFRFDTWHNVTAELRGARLSVQVSSDRLRDPVAVRELDLPPAALRTGAVAVAARGEGTADNVGVARLYEPVTEHVPAPEVGEQLPGYSDEFDGSTVPGTTPGSPWEWVRGPAPGVSAGGGALTWPTQDESLYLDDNTASVLTRAAPPGDYTVETKIDFAPGQPDQQAGILLHGNDDRWFGLTHKASPINQQEDSLIQLSQFDKEGERPTTDPPTPVATGPIFVGPTADTMWLRLSYHRDAAHNEHEVRAATSRNGKHWVHSGTWTLPVEGKLKIGLAAMSGTGAVARFDYLRTYR